MSVIPYDHLLVRLWNERHPVGTRVRFWLGARTGEPTGIATTRGPAELSDRTAVVWLQGRDDAVALSHVEVFPPTGNAEQ